MNTIAKFLLFACIAVNAVIANNDKVVIYWGQNSVGDELPLRDYCASPSVDIIVIGFVYEFPTAPGSNYPGINFANHCWKTFGASDPYFLDCGDSIGVDITYCQSLGKQVLLSFGGAVGTYGFSSDAQAQSFATTVWNMFLGGSATQRPFGTAIVDGIDLDIEAGSPRGYAAFITQLRSYFTAQTARTYYISGAPQCVYPDAMMGPGAGTALGEAWFDYVWVQFYNNYCGVNYYPSEFNFNVWAGWAATASLNPHVQIFVGAPGSQDAAGQGYVTAATLQVINAAVSATFPNNYGGIMLWDAGTAKQNGDFATQLAAFVHSTVAPVISTPTPTPTPVSTPTPTPSSPVVVSLTSTSSSTSTSTTTGAKASTTTTSSTGRPKTSTSTSAKATTTTTTGRAKTSTSTSSSTSSSSSSSTSGSGSSSGAACVNGHMKCAGANSYQTCTWGSWSSVQNCAANLKCSPSGDYIYCTY